MFGKKKKNLGGYGYNYGYDYGYGYGYDDYGYGDSGYYGKDGYGYGYGSSKIHEAVKTLRTNIQFSGIDNPVKSIVVTSTMPGEGKSTISHFLAIEMAKAGNKTLIVECDMRRPTQGNLFKIRPKKGITTYLSGECTLEEAATLTTTENLYLLDVDARIVNPVELLGSERFEKAMAEMKEKFDIVIYDTLPMGMFIESALVASHADATLLVIRKGRAEVTAIQAALAQLEKANARIIGAVLNDADVQKSLGYYGYYKYKYRKSYGKYKYNYDYGYGYGTGGRDKKD